MKQWSQFNSILSLAGTISKPAGLNQSTDILLGLTKLENSFWIGLRFAESGITYAYLCITGSRKIMIGMHRALYTRHQIKNIVLVKQELLPFTTLLLLLELLLLLPCCQNLGPCACL
jgi:hypothetical protein